MGPVVLVLQVRILRLIYLLKVTAVYGPIYHFENRIQPPIGLQIFLKAPSFAHPGIHQFFWENWCNKLAAEKGLSKHLGKISLLQQRQVSGQMDNL